MIRNRFSFSIALLLVFACHFGYAKATGAQTISGVVRDQHHAPVANAVVKISSPKGTMRAQTMTGAGGEFSLRTNETNDPGNLLLRVEAASFAVFEQKLTSNSTAPLETIADFPERKESAISPRASLLFKATNNLSLTASASRAFRQPTLNELYRSFRVGGILTLANENLQAERASSVEAGAILSGFNRRLNLRSNAFLTNINRPVANVTLDATQTLITRQRQNLGRTTSRGVELDAEMRLERNLTLSGGYLFADAIVARFPAGVALENLRVPQVARHQFTFQARYTQSSFANFGVQWRAGSSQFDDDQNKLLLNNYYTMDALVSRHLTRAVDLFLAAENLFDNRVETGRTPVTTLAAPRSLRIGLRLHFGGD